MSTSYIILHMLLMSTHLCKNAYTKTYNLRTKEAPNKGRAKRAHAQGPHKCKLAQISLLKNI